jgi:long-chain acyl-CoA synthetase
VHIQSIANAQPEASAVVMVPSGTTLNYGELASRANRLQHLFQDVGLAEGAHIALLMENRVEFVEVCVAAHRAGLYYTPISTHLRSNEASFIIQDSSAEVLITSVIQIEAAAAAVRAASHSIKRALMLDGLASGFESYEESTARQSASLEEELEGSPMLYSSGTTGRPKGVMLRNGASSESPADPWTEHVLSLFGIDRSTVFLFPGPLYHTSPLFYLNMLLRCGGTAVVMERFDPELALASIERYRVTHSFFVPTMLNRMLKLPKDIRKKYDLSSHIWTLHGAAPCAPKLKHDIIDWWGPIVWEGYAGSERNGMTYLNTDEWRLHPGSVGRPIGCKVKIIGDDGSEMETGATGVVCFSDGADFEYHNDPDKTAASHLPDGSSTIGDLGYLDSDGFLFLTGRLSDTIISGGVNVYPQETENVLIGHPAVRDVGVIGRPDDDWGEIVVAVVELEPEYEPSAALADELISYCRATISPIKTPRVVEFSSSLPRLPNGKLYKRWMKEGYEGEPRTSR